MMKTVLTLLAVGILTLAGSRPAVAEEHIGPHKGAIVEWGEEEYHLEVVTDAKAGTVTVYVYGGEADLKAGKARAIDARSLVMTVKADKTVTVKLEPAPAKGDADGTASVFTGKHAVFSRDAKLTGTVSGKVGAKPYSGEFKQK
jgi:hypothetical protein